jgi:hypothetical protein
MQSRPPSALPSDHCHFAAPSSTRRPPTHHAPGEVERVPRPPRSRSRHAIRHIDRRGPLTTPIQTHRPSLASNRARKRSAVPTRFSGATTTHTKWASAGQPAASSPPLPRCQLVRTTGHWRRATPRARGPGLGHPPPAKSSARLQCCQLARGRGHWTRTQALDLALSGKGPPSGSSSQLATGLGRRETALEHP